MKNTKYGHFDEGQKIVYADNPVLVDGAIVYNPSKAQYNSIGEKELHLEYPADPAPTGYHYEEDGFDETATDITKKWKTVADPVVPKRYSVPDLFFWLKGYDTTHPETPKGQAVVDFLNAQNMYTIAVTTRVVSEDNEYFAPTLAAVKEAVGLTDAEIAEALAYAETDASPDMGV